MGEQSSSERGGNARKLLEVEDAILRLVERHGRAISDERVNASCPVDRTNASSAELGRV
jgi:hypothetical protein